MPQSLQKQFADSHGDQMQLSGLSIDPTTIRPESLSGLCITIGQILNCLGLAQNDYAEPEEHDLAIG